MDIVAASRLAGEHCWVESQLFELLGTWMKQVDDPALVISLAERCTERGELAEAWRSRIASIPGLNAASLVAAPEGLGAVFAHLRSLEGAPGLQLAALEADVLPAVRSVYLWHREQVDALIDTPTARLLDRCLAA